MTDNRTNEQLSGNTGQFTEAQVKAAQQAWLTYPHKRGDLSNAENAMRAALVAAQGAAPQAESAPNSSYISPSLPGMIRNMWKSDPSESSVRTALKLAGDLIQELIDMKAAPVLPSSGVDEDALRPFLKNLIFQYNQERVTLKTATRYLAEWLKGQGNAARE